MEAGNVCKQLINRENQRLSARRIKYTLEKLKGSGITRIKIEEGNLWNEVKTKEHAREYKKV